jgi:hypothetical protein
MARRTTVEKVPRHDLSEAMEIFYRGHFDLDHRGAVFDRWMDRVRPGLVDAARHRADPAFVLHVLVCTWDRRIRRYSDEVEAARRLTPRKKALLLGAFRVLRTLGEPWIAEILNTGDSDRGRRFLLAAAEIETALTGVVMRTPAWQGGARVRGRTRAGEDAVTACIICLFDELRIHPKPAAAIADLLAKSELLRRSRGGTAGPAFVAKRAARARDKAKDRLGPIGNVVWLMRSTYASIRESLLTIPELPDSSPIWKERGRAWGTTEVRFRRAFHGFCRAQDLRRHVEALQRFETVLAAEREQGQGRIPDVLRYFEAVPLAKPDERS